MTTTSTIDLISKKQLTADGDSYYPKKKNKKKFKKKNNKYCNSNQVPHDLKISYLNVQKFWKHQPLRYRL